MIILHRELCIHCGACMQYCTQGAIVTEEGRAKLLPERCNGCGACIKSCYMLAIERSEDAK